MSLYRWKKSNTLIHCCVSKSKLKESYCVFGPHHSQSVNTLKIPFNLQPRNQLLACVNDRTDEKIPALPVTSVSLVLVNINSNFLRHGRRARLRCFDESTKQIHREDLLALMGGKCCWDGFQRCGAEPGSLFSLMPRRRMLTGEEVWLLRGIRLRERRLDHQGWGRFV